MFRKKLEVLLRYFGGGSSPPPISRFTPNRQLCSDLLVRLKSENFASYDPVVASTTNIVVLFPNIEAYTEYLVRLLTYLKQEKYINSMDVFAEERTTTVEKFIISNDGYYLNAEKAVARFKETALQLCEAMEPADTEEYGYFESAMRMLTDTFINLREVAEKLTAVSE